ncbi:MAG: hypothetical protein ACYTG2_14345 [Planctomycetota bacterium]|jgi:hypothetical protein
MQSTLKPSVLVFAACALTAAMAAPLHAQCKEQKLAGIPGHIPDEHGTSVAMDGDRLLVGTPGADAGLSTGFAVLYDWDGNSWVQNLDVSSTLDIYLGFVFNGVENAGTSVSIDGDVLAIGAPRNTGVGDGRVLVFEEVGGVWDWAATFASTTDSWGSSVAIVDGPSGWVLAVGQPEGGFLDHGEVSIHLEGVGLVDTLDAADVFGAVNAGDRFGHALAIDENPSGGLSLLVGKPGGDEFGMDVGTCVIFNDPGTLGAGFTADLVYNLFDVGAEFGTSVALDGGRALVGGPLSDASAVDGGEWHFFEWNGTN